MQPGHPGKHTQNGIQKYPEANIFNQTFLMHSGALSEHTHHYILSKKWFDIIALKSNELHQNQILIVTLSKISKLKAYTSPVDMKLIYNILVKFPRGCHKNSFSQVNILIYSLI